MNIKQKHLLLVNLDRIFPKWYKYLEDIDFKRRDTLSLKDIPDGYKTAMILSEVNVDIEKDMSYLQGMCDILDLKLYFDKQNKMIKILNSKNKILFYTNGNTCNFDLEKITMDCIAKYSMEGRE